MFGGGEAFEGGLLGRFKEEKLEKNPKQIEIGILEGDGSVSGLCKLLINDESGSV